MSRTDIVLHRGDLGVQIDPARLFERAGPLVLEVGFGDGTFLVHLAEAHPAWNLLGAEVSLGSVSRAFRRLRRHGHRQARLYRGDAQFLVRDVLPPGSLHRIYVNFPDPWPKKKHRDRRLLQTSFFRLTASRLEDGGALLFTSDHEEYFAFALAQAAATGLFAVEQKTPPPATLTTKYARKWQAQDKRIQHAVFTRTAPPDEHPSPIIETCDAMHHAIFEGDLPDLDAFEKQVHAFDQNHVILLEAFRSVNDGGLLFVARIEEPDLTQEVLLEVRPSDDQYVVGIKPWGQPLVTRGTREAVGVAARWLEAHGMEQVHRSY